MNNEMNDMLSQEEIDLLLKGSSNEDSLCYDGECINEMEKDTIGEIGNISMGTAATTLSTLLNRKVIITTPKVEITTTNKLADEYPIPFVAVDVKYKKGLEGSNVLIIKEDDVKVITDIMMGNEINVDRELTELDLSAISEVMNQMMGSAATSLSEMFGKRIDIEPPKSYNISFKEGKEKLEVLQTDGPIIRVSFKIFVEDLLDSNFVQLIPIDFGVQMVENLMESSKVTKVASELSVSSKNIFEDVKEINQVGQDKIDSSSEDDLRKPQHSSINEKHVIVKEPVFESFDDEPKSSHTESDKAESIDLVGDIPVEITVELGRTVKKIGEILEYGPGTVIELDKLVGEPLNIYANGKYIAKGEVVVIDDNFGVRITDINNKINKNI